MKNSAATLCSLSLGLWGYQTGAWNLAIPMILALESRNFINRRWTISWEHFKLIHVLAAFIWLLSIFYIPSSSPASISYSASYHIIKCVPVGLFILILAQTYCTNFGDLYGFIFNKGHDSNKNINLYYPYFGICLLSASVTGGNNFLFLSMTAGLVTLFLGSLRSQRFSPAMFYSLIGVALILSIIGSNQFYWLQANVKPKSPDLFGSLSKNLTSLLSQKHNQPAKDLFDKDSLNKVEQLTKNITDTALKNADQSNQSLQNAGSSPSATPPTQTPQNTTSPNINPSIEGIELSQGTEPAKSAPQSTESSQTAGLPQGATQSTQGGELPQNVTQSNSGISSSSNTAQQIEPSGNIATSTSSQNATQSIEGTQTTAEPNALQNINQSEDNTNNNSPSQSFQDISQNASSSKDIQSPQNIIQQGSGTVDPQKSLTQIGNSGSLQPSDTILFRVALNNQKQSNYSEPIFPLYIREATYNQYSLGAWNAVNSNFVSKDSVSNTRQWILGTQNSNTTSVRISAALPQGISVLKLPIGTSKIDHPAINLMQVNQYGSVMVQGNSGESTYTVEFDSAQFLDSPPTQLEMDIPEAEKPAIQKILKSLNLEGRSKSETIQLISNFFKNNFEYSLELPQVQKNSTPLSTFLLDRRSGHCEYFASATSLLLRSAGIPTRYAVGYSVHEYSPSEQEYVVRARNAHAWVMAYVNGSWLTVDTTPSSRQLQNSDSENIEKISKNGISQDKKNGLTSNKLNSQNNNLEKTADQDIKSKNIQAFLAKISDQWKLQSTRLTKKLDPRVLSGGIIILGLVITILSMFFAWWVSRRYFSRRLKSLKRSTERLSRQSKDDDLASAFSRIEKRLTEWGVERKSSETVRQWIVRLKQNLPESKMNHLNEIIDLHYRYRFDPQGIEQEDCTKLRSMIKSWLMDTAA
jgi:hypothetical protein